MRLPTGKIEIDAKDPQFLQTVRGLGYRLLTQG
jgi:DNA-binding response OmpR family regulator